MGHFVKWIGPNLNEGAPRISQSEQKVEVGQAFRCGVWGGSSLKITPNDATLAQINVRTAVDSSSNNITWYEIVGLKEGNATIRAINPGDDSDTQDRVGSGQRHRIAAANEGYQRHDVRDQALDHGSLQRLVCQVQDTD